MSPPHLSCSCVALEIKAANFKLTKLCLHARQSYFSRIGFLSSALV